MPHTRRSVAAIATRNARLLAAERDRDTATRDAEIDYSETIRKIREYYEAELAEAGRIRADRVSPAQRAYNAAVIAAERAAG